MKKQRGFLLNPFRFGGGAVLLDGYTTGLWGCYGLDKWLTAYGGSAIRVRRSSDNTEQDIGFASGLLDTAALATFVGANDGFVVTWYDQSGGGNNLTQATAADQALIVDAGTYTEELLTDGTSDGYVTVNSSGTPTAFTVFQAGRIRDANSANQTSSPAYEHANTTMASTLAEDADDTTDRWASSLVLGAAESTIDTAQCDDSSVYAFRGDLSFAGIINQATLWKNGVQEASIGTTGTVGFSSFTAGAWSLGKNTANNRWVRMGVRSFLIYETGVLNATIAAISAVIKPATPLGAIDSYTSNLWSCCSVRKQVTAYGGSCLRVRRSSDNTEQDIGFVSGFLDTASMLTFVGAGNGFVVRVYDQSGGGNHFEQTTTSAQPRVVNGGVLETNMAWTGATFLVSVNNAATVTGHTAFIKGNNENPNTTSAGPMLLNIGTNIFAAGFQANWVYGRAELEVGTSSNGSANFRANKFSRVRMPGTVLCARWDRSQATAAAQDVGYSGGKKLTATSTAAGGAVPSGNNSAAKWYWGANGGASDFMVGNFESMVIYQSVIADADAERISRRLG